jgi:hypothetical protein
MKGILQDDAAIKRQRKKDHTKTYRTSPNESLQGKRAMFEVLLHCRHSNGLVPPREIGRVAERRFNLQSESKDLRINSNIEQKKKVKKKKKKQGLDTVHC